MGFLQRTHKFSEARSCDCFKVASHSASGPKALFLSSW